ncbi:hypothetical protein BGY98DRAFT_1094877 [Russula aff. rugulosa BPL654]|nr:hypothetical protein BGY98DRAFT_1094877 [Russula aff. rugulosa BPL654]
MSLTIKVPRKGNASPSASESTAVRRKSNRRRVTTDSEEDYYEPSPPRAETRPKRRATPRVKAHLEREEGASTPVERKPPPTRARDRNQPGGSKRPRDEALSPDEPEEKVDIVAALDAESSINAATSATLQDATKEESTNVSLPPFKKKRLPPIRKNKPGTVPSTSGTSSQSAAAKPVLKPPESKGGPSFAQEDTMDPLSALKRPKRVNNQQEVNLNDRSVYESLFKHSGGSTPRAGLNPKEKEERRRELDRMREEDRARRAADAEHVFDLRAQHDKITSFVERLQVRRSAALWPNILAVAFRQERERDERRREQERARQAEIVAKEKGTGEVPVTG